MSSIIPYEKIPQAFYESDDVVKIARDLLGKYLFTEFDGLITAGMIVETEAYNGRMDKACHAFRRRTERTEVMYGSGGVAYVYLCYGIHHLFNIVTNKPGLADAVLVRALQPEIGIDIMKERRKTDHISRLTSGPGVLAEAMGIRTHHTGEDLKGEKIWLATNTGGSPGFEVETDVRIGVDYAGEDAFLPWRFYYKNNQWVSKTKPRRKKSGPQMHS